MSQIKANCLFAGMLTLAACACYLLAGTEGLLLLTVPLVVSVGMGRA